MNFASSFFSALQMDQTPEIHLTALIDDLGSYRGARSVISTETKSRFISEFTASLEPSHAALLD